MEAERFGLFKHSNDSSLNIFVPFDSEKRPDFVVDNVSCPYDGIEISLAFRISKKLAAREVSRNKEYDFCWNHCDVEDCPTYVEERDEKRIINPTQ